MFTDFWEPCAAVLSAEHHRRVGKYEVGTQGIERFNCAPRQRCSRLVRKSWSFSKERENHVGEIWDHLPRHNATLPA